MKVKDLELELKKIKDKNLKIKFRMPYLVKFKVGEEIEITISHINEGGVHLEPYLPYDPIDFL